MKRRRGSKKGKAKKKPNVTTTNEDVNAENDVLVVEEGEEMVADAVTESSAGSGSDSGGDGDGDRVRGGGEEEEENEAPPTSTADAVVDQAPPKPTTTGAVGFSDSTIVKAVYRRVKVKIKTAKTLLLDGSPETHPPAEKSSQQPEEQEGVSSEKMEADSVANSLSKANNNNSNSNNNNYNNNNNNNNVSPSEGEGGGDSLRKSAGIKIKSKSFSSNFSPCINIETLKGEKTPKKESLSVSKDSSRYNKKELDAALEVIKKVMKMDAAEPFNTPVDPIALGIPDYFEVIDTPMDFGTICGNLESGIKYLNSEDVYKDVQCIWDNCYKYNNKGDLVLDLMKRVKKNFSKYWIASGLYSDYTHGIESSQTKDATPPDSNGTEQLKGGSSLSNNKTRKLQGLRKHKTGCLCAICVMIRRRQEREESSAKILEEQQAEAASSDYVVVRPEEMTGAAESAGGCEYASSNMESSPPELDIDSNAHVEEEAKLAANISENDDDNQEEEVKKLGFSSRISIEDDRTKHQKQTVECGGDVLTYNDKEALLTGGETVAGEQPKPKEEKLDKHQKAKMLEKLRYLENPRVLGLCRTLFAEDHNTMSVWNGPHSLTLRQKDPLASSTCLKKRSAIRNAVSQLIRLQQGK